MHHSCWLYSPFWIYSFWYGRVSAQKHYNYMKWFFSVRTTSLAWKYSTGPQLCNCATLVGEQVMRVEICCCILFLFMYSRWHINFYGLMKEWSKNLSTLFCTGSGGSDWFCSCYCGSSLPHWNKTSLNAELLGFVVQYLSTFSLLYHFSHLWDHWHSGCTEALNHGYRIGCLYRHWAQLVAEARWYTVLIEAESQIWLGLN